MHPTLSEPDWFWYSTWFSTMVAVCSPANSPARKLHQKKSDCSARWNLGIWNFIRWPLFFGQMPLFLVALAWIHISERIYVKIPNPSLTLSPAVPRIAYISSGFTLDIMMMKWDFQPWNPKPGYTFWPKLGIVLSPRVFPRMAILRRWRCMVWLLRLWAYSRAGPLPHATTPSLQKSCPNTSET